MIFDIRHAFLRWLFEGIEEQASGHTLTRTPGFRQSIFRLSQPTRQKILETPTIIIYILHDNTILIIYVIFSRDKYIFIIYIIEMPLIYALYKMSIEFIYLSRWINIDLSKIFGVRANIMLTSLSLFKFASGLSLVACTFITSRAIHTLFHLSPLCRYFKYARLAFSRAHFYYYFRGHSSQKAHAAQALFL